MKEREKLVEKRQKRIQKESEKAIKEAARQEKEALKESQRKEKEAEKEQQRRASEREKQAQKELEDDEDYQQFKAEEQESQRTAEAEAVAEARNNKPRKLRKFCNLPTKGGRVEDPTWVDIYMADVDEVGAHCGLFFSGPHYEKLVGDVGNRIVGWVQDDLTKRAIQDMGV